MTDVVSTPGRTEIGDGPRQSGGQALTSERARIAFVERRDGRQAARAWVKRTRDAYARALASGTSHASSREYRGRFRMAIREFDDWLAATRTDAEAADGTQDRDAAGNPT